MAIRAANRALSAEGWTWEQLLRNKITIVADPFTAMARPTNGTQDDRYARATRPVPPRPRTPPPPPSPPPPPPKTCTRPNTYQGSCYCCGVFVAATKGFIFDITRFRSSPTTWEIACTSCSSFLNSGGSPPPRKVRPRRMTTDDVFSSL